MTMQNKLSCICYRV